MAKGKQGLTDKDRLVLESYKTAAEALGAYLGEAFEIVLHDLGDLDNSVIKIIHGEHSGREEGAPITDFALGMLDQIKNNNSDSFSIYYTKSKYGKPVKSTTFAIFGENNRVIGLMCINLYLDSPLTAILNSFGPEEPAEFSAENFTQDSDELVLRSLETVKKAVDQDYTVPVSQKNKEIVTILFHQGVFKLKNAVKVVSRSLGISKNTVYMHLRALEN
jgi:predicted transcriptional regulator YheO